MPLPLRKVEPVHVARGNLPEKFKVQNDLEAESNGTLANVILQLSSLSHHAGEIFTDLVRVASDISTRSANLQGRLDRIAVKVAQMDGVHEEYSMQDCLNTKPFQSSTSFDQQVVSRPTMPAGMLKAHMSCDRPPPLEKLNVYRDDGKDGLKFYTDPSYFFDLWKREMLTETEKAVRKPHKPKPKGEGRKPNKRIRELQKTREKQALMARERGEHIMEPNIRSPTDAQSSRPIEMGDSVIYPPEAMSRRMNSSRPQSMEIKDVSFDGNVENEEKLEPISSVPSSMSAKSSQATTPTDRASRAINNTRENLPPPPPPPPLDEEEDTNNHHHHHHHHNGNYDDPSLPPPMIDDEDFLPPPPPTPDQYQVDHHGMDATKYIRAPLLQEENLPPSPPPPPPPLMMESLQSPTESQNGKMITTTKEKRVIPPAVPDTRSELLRAIRGGINLKKVDEKKVSGGKDDKGGTALCDVASILARRAAVEMSDSDDSCSSEGDSDDWNETSA